MSALEIVGLCKGYGTQSVLRNLDLEVETGSFTSILGPSGSGKTTLLRVIAGFERIDRGRVLLRGQVVDDGAAQYTGPSKRRIGYVPQDGSLFPHLSIEQNVGFGRRRRDRRGSDVAELLEMVGLSGLERRYPHQLSGGQQQRVALARALAIAPTLVLLDEPFSSLDASLRTTVRGDVRRVLREAGATAILVTHDRDEALSLADRVAIMRDGGIGQYDPPVVLYTHPSTPELASGLGESNYLHGIASGGGVETPLGLLELESLWGESGNVSKGTSLLVLVRPEQIVLSRELANAHGTARVVATEFYGHDAVVRLRADWDNSAIIVRTADATNLPGENSPVALSVRGPVVAWESGKAPASA
jgi:iron(III) transport system ATP-binding protein